MQPSKALANETQVKAEKDIKYSQLYRVNHMNDAFERDRDELEKQEMMKQVRFKDQQGPTEVPA
jgi:hypothetical protein